MFSRRILLGSLVAGAASAAAVPAASAALVVPGHSVGKVKLFQTRPTVQRELGKPDRITGEDFPGIDWHYTKRNLDVWFGDVDNATSKKSKVDYVFELVTHNNADHTRKGIHPASTMRAVRRAYPSLRCDEGTSAPCYTGRSKRLDLYNYTFFGATAGILSYFAIGTDTCCYGH